MTATSAPTTVLPTLALGEPPPVPRTEKVSPVTLHNVCDKCGVAALWRVTLISGELLFCAHHGRQYGFAGEDSHFAYADENKLRGDVN